MKTIMLIGHNPADHSDHFFLMGQAQSEMNDSDETFGYIAKKAYAYRIEKLIQKEEQSETNPPSKPMRKKSSRPNRVSLPFINSIKLGNMIMNDLDQLQFIIGYETDDEHKVSTRFHFDREAFCLDIMQCIDIFDPEDLIEFWEQRKYLTISSDDLPSEKELTPTN